MADDNTPPGDDPLPDDPEDGGSEDESQSVTLKQFKAAIKSATETAQKAADEKLNELRRELAELKAKPNAAPAPAQQGNEPKVYSRAQLTAFVTAGSITQEQADTYWENQLRESLRKEVTETVTQTMTGTTLAEKLSREVEGYKELAPGAWVEGSTERTKVRTEYDFLVSLGHPAGLQTEVTALRAAMGPLSSLRAAKAAKPGTAESHVETGGSKPGDGGKPDPLKSMTPKEKIHFTHLVNQGIETWGNVRKQLASRAARQARRA